VPSYKANSCNSAVIAVPKIQRPASGDAGRFLPVFLLLQISRNYMQSLESFLHIEIKDLGDIFAKGA
jgi:hypothetical protein